MKVTVAIDSFKGSLSSIEAASAVRDGIIKADPTCEVVLSPLADGGEGTVEAIVSASGGRLVELSVTGPLGTPTLAKYGVTPDGYAVIEMASAAGITLVADGERNPERTTTFGVGELIRHAIEVEGCRKFIVGIGGSATNDGGVGMLGALGFEFTDCDGKPISLTGGGLATLATVNTKNALKELSECEFLVACDVKNPLCGENGCSAVYGPQKGATPEMISRMDAYLARYADITASVLGHDERDTHGAGAAGGMGFAFISYLGARLESGIELVIKISGLEEHIKNSDVVVTGEGRLDGQSGMGKAPVGVAKAAKKYGKPVIALSGCVASDAKLCNGYGIDAFFPIIKAPITLADAMSKKVAEENLCDAAEQVFRLINTFKKH